MMKYDKPVLTAGIMLQRKEYVFPLQSTVSLSRVLVKFFLSISVFSKTQNSCYVARSSLKQHHTAGLDSNTNTISQPSEGSIIAKLSVVLNIMLHLLGPLRCDCKRVLSALLYKSTWNHITFMCLLF